MKIKTSDLIGRPLDWVVQVAFWSPESPGENPERYSTSTSWALGGIIIETEGISLWHKLNVEYSESGKETRTHLGWQAGAHYLPQECRHRFDGFGPTPLIAAMRCYVQSKLGDEVEVPDELIGTEP